MAEPSSIAGSGDYFGSRSFRLTASIGATTARSDRALGAELRHRVATADRIALAAHDTAVSETASTMLFIESPPR